MARMAGSSRMWLRAWGFDLPHDWVEYDNALKTDIRTELRRRRRKIETEGPVRFVRARSEVQGRQIFDALQRQQKARFAQLGRPDILEDPVFSRYYKSVIFDNWAKGFCLLSALVVRDEIVATSFALNHNGHYLVLMHSFEPGHWHTKSPGILLMDNSITHQIESGSRYFDLTIGNELYKRKFGATEKALYSWEQGSSPLGQIYAAMRQARRFAGGQIRKLPEKYWPARLKA